MLVKEIIDTENREKEFDSPFGVVNVSAERNMYVVLNKKYIDLAKKAKKKFSLLYNQYKDCADIYNNAEEDFMKAIVPVVDAIKQDLISMGQYDIDYAVILHEINDMNLLDAFYTTYETLIDKIDDILGAVEANRDYREARKACRGRWEVSTFGGGFINAGLNQLECNAVNGLIGMAHSAANAVGNARDKARATSQLENFFKDKRIRIQLENAVYITTIRFQFCLISLLQNCEPCVYWDFPSLEDIGKGERLLNNLESGVIPQTEQQNVYQEAFHGLCFDGDIYVHLLNKFGDQDGKIRTLFQYFGVDLKESFEDAIKEKYDLSKKYTIEELEKIEIDFSKLMKKCDVKKSETMDILVLNKKDLIEKTISDKYNSSKHDTVEELEKLENNLLQIMKRHNVKKSETMDKLLSDKNELIKEHLEEMYESGIKDTEEDILKLQNQIETYVQERNNVSTITISVINNKLKKNLEEIKEKHLEEMYEKGIKETEEDVLMLQQQLNDYMAENDIKSSEISDKLFKCLNEVRESYLEEIYRNGSKETKEEAIALQMKIQDYMKERDMATSRANDKILKCIEDIDKALRTYKGTVYSSQDESKRFTIECLTKKSTS